MIFTCIFCNLEITIEDGNANCLNHNTSVYFFFSNSYSYNPIANSISKIKPLLSMTTIISNIYSIDIFNDHANIYTTSPYIKYTLPIYLDFKPNVTPENANIMLPRLANLKCFK